MFIESVRGILKLPFFHFIKPTKNIIPEFVTNNCWYQRIKGPVTEENNENAVPIALKELK